jgi:hypothetical protein
MPVHPFKRGGIDSGAQSSINQIPGVVYQPITYLCCTTPDGLTNCLDSRWGFEFLVRVETNRCSGQQKNTSHRINIMTVTKIEGIEKWWWAPRFGIATADFGGLLVF